MSQQPDSRGSTTAWLVVLIVSLNTALNAFLYMNTAAAEDEMEKVTGTDVSELCSYFLYTATVGMTPGMFVAVKWEGLGLGFSVFLNVGAAWVRWLSMTQGSYALLLISTFMCGAATWTILSLPAQISQRRFPREMWTLTTSAMVQANYAGWLIGSIVPPLFTSKTGLAAMCLWTAIITSPCVILFLTSYRSSTTQDKLDGSAIRKELSASVIGEDMANGHDMSEGSFSKFFGVCIKHPLYILQLLGSATLGGISFVQPAAAIFILKEFGYGNKTAVPVNVAFIGVGVVAGIVIGKFCNDPKHFGSALKLLFIVNMVSLILCSVLAETDSISQNNHFGFILLLILSALCGLTSLGFIGVAIEAAALYPVGAGYACWGIEILIQVISGSLGFWVYDKHGFTKLAGCSVLATLMILVGYRYPQSRLIQDEVH